MNMINRKLHLFVSIIFCICMFYLINGCNSIADNRLRGNPNAPLPGQVKDVTVKNLPGAAHIFYSLPGSKNLLYVEAVYTTKKDATRKVKSSRYNNDILIKGFANNKPHKVKLYSYSLSGETSDNPVTVTVDPLTPPFRSVYKTIEVQNTFGGIFVRYSGNKTNSDLGIVFIKDSSGVISQVQANFTSKESGKFAIRGLNAKKYKLGYYVRDQYQNRSDTTFGHYIPLFEGQLDKSKFSNAKFPTDTWQNPRFGSFRNIYDNASNRDRAAPNYFSPVKETMPIWITIDLGQATKISRIIYYGVQNSALYNGAYMKKFQLWGSLNPNLNPEEPFDDSWTLLGTFKSKTPSSNNASITRVPYPENGVEFLIPNAASKPYIRYLRIVCIKTFSGINEMAIGELDVFGSPKNNNNNN